MTQGLRTFFISLVLLCSNLFVINFTTLATEDIISLRVVGMRNADEAMAQIKQSISSANFQKAGQEASKISLWAENLLSFFPAGSGASVTNLSAASDAIWEKTDLFQRIVQNKQLTAKKMVSASKGSDLDKLAQAFEEARMVCESCHEKFRN